MVDLGYRLLRPVDDAVHALHGRSGRDEHLVDAPDGPLGVVQDQRQAFHERLRGGDEPVRVDGDALELLERTVRAKQQLVDPVERRDEPGDQLDRTGRRASQLGRGAHQLLHGADRVHRAGQPHRHHRVSSVPAAAVRQAVQSTAAGAASSRSKSSRRPQATQSTSVPSCRRCSARSA